MPQNPAETHRSNSRWPLAAIAITGTLLLVLLAAYRGFGWSRTLAVQTQPQGASVFLNGRLAGKTPLRMTGLSGGSYSLRIEKENYAPLTLPIVLGLGTTTIEKALPARGTGGIKIEIAPDGAEVLLDGELAGHTPLELSGVPVGSHDLTVRKTNFKSFSQRIDVQPNATLPFKGVVLEDMILAMLQSAIDNDKQRVSNYMDMGHYLFANNRIRESADYYVRGLHVASEPLQFPTAATPEERNLEVRLRGEDVTRINDDIRKKQGHNGQNVARKDMELFIKLVNQEQEQVAGKNAGEWQWVQAQAENFNKDSKYESAERLYQRHIELAKGMPSVAQAYIGMITVRLRMKRATEGVQASNDLLTTPYGRDSAILRQAANTIYSNAGGFTGQERGQLLSQAEVLLRRALAGAPKRSEMSALCKFELAYVLTQEERHEESLPLYRDSVIETQEPSTKELRNQRLIDALRTLKRYDEAREILKLLKNSPRDYIKRNAEEQLKELGEK